MSLAGLTVPVPTLFGPDGQLDPGKNARFVRDLADAKVDHLFVLGSLGEFPSVTDEERARLYEAVIDSVTGAADAWVGCGAPSTRQAVHYAEEAENAGAAAVVAVPPYYLHPEPESIVRYYRAIHGAVKIPLLAYNIPSAVGYALAPPLVHQLYAEGTIAGTKDTAGSLTSIEAMISGAPEGFVVLPGDDMLASAAMERGSQGAVMGIGNVCPKLCLALLSAARSHDSAKILELQSLVDALVGVVRTGPFPATVKFLSSELRHADVGYRAPYDALSEEGERVVQRSLEPLRPKLASFLGR
jgi:4-hydroxy-tetrahydrodipicolinate synthase